MVQLNQVPSVILMLVFAGLVIGAGLLALTQFQTAIASSTTLAGNLTTQAMNNVTTSVSNFSLQFPVIGTILGVAVLIVVVMVAFAFGGNMVGGRGAVAAGN